MNLNLEVARSESCLLFECVSGSRAYGLDTPESDTDLRGVFVAPRQLLYGFGAPDQVSDESHDQSYFEIGRFVELLLKNNPNILEMLYTASDCVRFKNPLFNLLKPEMFLSKLCEATFSGYAITQVRKARGLNKKIVNPVNKERKSLLDFCHVLAGQGSEPLLNWLSERGLDQRQCGLVNIPHMREVYGIYIDRDGTCSYRGVLSKKDSTMVACSRIDRDAEPAAWMSVNVDGFKKYCKNYHEYWEWVEKRNDARYQTNVDHGRNYDSKNMMHTFRLLDVAKEIAAEGRITVRSPNRDWLLKVRAGEFLYDYLLAQAEDRIAEITTLFEKCSLQDQPCRASGEAVLVEIRERFYHESAA
ncbi:MAG: nucleotidyltransferase domain-containing protein [Verrucomicrobiota bacterium]